MPGTTWQPTEADLSWSKSLLHNLKHGGVWFVPAVGEYVLDRKEKKLRLRKRWTISDEEMHQMIVTAFGACGYEVTDEVAEGLN